MHIKSEKFSLEAHFSSLQHLPQIINTLILCWPLLITALPPSCNPSPLHIAPRLGNGGPANTSHARRGQHWPHWTEAPGGGEQSSRRPRSDFRFHGSWQGPLWGRCKQGHKPVLGQHRAFHSWEPGKTSSVRARCWTCRRSLLCESGLICTSASESKVAYPLLSGKSFNVHECPWQSLERRHDQDEPGTAEGLGQVLSAFCPQYTHWLTLQPRGSAACHVWCRATMLASLFFLLQVKPCHFFLLGLLFSVSHVSFFLDLFFQFWWSISYSNFLRKGMWQLKFFRYLISENDYSILILAVYFG